jgi:drug/metabolite transporter (DMT)-like permease
VTGVQTCALPISLLFSRFYLKETLKSGDVAGLFLVVCGVLLIVVGSS